LVIVAGSAIFIFVVALPYSQKMTYSASSPKVESQETEVRPEVPTTIHLETPEPLKALYMTACVAGTLSWRESLKNLIEITELNAVVIDIKDYTGVVSFPNNFPKSGVGRGCVVSDMKEYVRELHNANIYVIGRVSVFQDVSYVKVFPDLAVRKKSDGEIWKDYKGLTFVDVGAKPYWDYIVNISKEAYELVFDELNYDYVRYPSDGLITDAHYTHTSTTTTKELQLEAFFSYLYENLKIYRLQNLKTSVDLFGMTTTVENDMGIGQLLETALPYFDYIAPMVYPSHYPKTWNGFANPANHPYEVIKIAMSRGMEREMEWNILNGNFSVDEFGATTTPVSKFRPWLQDFNLGATYGPDKIRAQIEATYDVGLTSWMLWNAGNKYTAGALLPAEGNGLVE
jgi:hypothetical protein